MSKNAKTSLNFGGQSFASFRRKHELFSGPFFSCHEISEISAPVLVDEAGASVRAQKSLKKRTSTTNKQRTQVSWKCWVWTIKRLRRKHYFFEAERMQFCFYLIRFLSSST